MRTNMTCIFDFRSDSINRDKKCAISHNIDGSEDDYLYRENMISRPQGKTCNVINL